MRCAPMRTAALMVVFGAGGDRDAGKRTLMGTIAAEKADRVIITDDNPPQRRTPRRSEPRSAPARPGAVEIGDRAEAIRQRGGAELAGR